MQLPTLPGLPDINGIANLLGRGVSAMHAQLCAIAGYLAPSTVPNVRAGTTTSGAAGAFSSADVLVIPFQTKRIDITLFDNGVYIQTSQNVDGNWDTKFELIGPGFYSFPLACRRIGVSRSGASESRYSVVGWV